MISFAAYVLYYFLNPLYVPSGFIHGQSSRIIFCMWQLLYLVQLLTWQTDLIILLMDDAIFFSGSWSLQCFFLFFLKSYNAVEIQIYEAAVGTSIFSICLFSYIIAFAVPRRPCQCLYPQSLLGLYLWLINSRYAYRPSRVLAKLFLTDRFCCVYKPWPFSYHLIFS